MSNISHKIIKFPCITDDRGNLTFIEGLNHIPFTINRVYWIFDVPGGALRNGHAYHTQEECIIALSGSVDIFIDDGKTSQLVTLDRAYMGLCISKKIWREIHNFSTNAVVMVLASGPYSKSEYITDKTEFKRIYDQKI